MSEKTYNGWTNYETWNVKLWIDNDEGSARYWEEVADNIVERNTSDNDEEQRECDKGGATLELADALKEYMNDNAPDLGSSCYADLLNAALSEVNWWEIAEHMVDDALERVAA